MKIKRLIQINLTTVLFVFINQAFTVAIIDTGIDLKNEKLKSLLWKNSSEIINGLDDDGNGLIDDINGYDFSLQNPIPSDAHGHGTHIAGIIQQAASQVKDLRMMILKFYHPGMAGGQAATASVLALRYAIDKNVDMINFSMGGYVPMNEEFELLKLARDKGIVVVAASGNDSLNLQKHPFYPGSYRLQNIFQVFSINRNGQRSRFSNYDSFDSKYRVRNGEEVLSYGITAGETRTMSGTSQAAAIFTRDAAQFLQNLPKQIRIERMANFQ